MKIIENIKEKIKYFKHYVVDNLSLDAQDDFQKILDYITNLQEKNERLNNIINKIHQYCKENQVIDRLELLCIIKEDKINELYDKVKDLELKGDASNE